ncbi:universal stress protein [Sediminicola luteus]|uniref:Universal stress protein UspA n=1 Tax=Sediminicola luteus TaxID=319238 RepID=A0A2A4GDD9_9FLAO|nr:universal stress protein [Sediminicola luteus]PCE65996.1 universal stress protein UspA [Sediminicola luteus]
MKKFIVPVDFSEQSEYALKVAASLAKRHDAEILALHMLELSEAFISSSEVNQHQQMLFLIKLAEKRFSDFVKKPFLEGVQVTPIIKHFKVFNELNEVAKEQGADLIIMGSHGTDGLKELFIGSNAEKVVRNMDIPVLVIKNDWDDFKVEQMVFACDFQKENLPAYKKAKAFAELLNAQMNLVFINTPGDDFLSTSDAYDRISKFQNLAHNGQEVEIYNHYTIEKGILEFSEKTNADLIAIPTHGRKGLLHFFMGSIGEDIANHSKIPVMTFKI